MAKKFVLLKKGNRTFTVTESAYKSSKDRYEAEGVTLASEDEILESQGVKKQTKKKAKADE